MKKIYGVVGHVEGNNVLVARRFNLRESDAGFSRWKRWGSLPIPNWRRLAGFSSMLRRMLRSEVSHWRVLSSGTHLVIAAGAIYRKRLNEPWARVAPLRGRRPLALAQTPDDCLYYGEYHHNPERSPVAVWSSNDDGSTFTPVWTFQDVRHVHGVFHDPYTGALWVTTGDTDAESGIWVTENRFKTLEKVAGGSQQIRCVQLLFTKTHVYFGSDAPREINFLHRLERKSGGIEKLEQVNSPVFWGCKVGEHLFFSTVVEPTSISPTRYAWIWGSKDGETWKRLKGFRKDVWPMRLCQYGQVQFPSGKNDTGYLFFTLIATEKHGTVQFLKVSDFF